MIEKSPFIASQLEVGMKVDIAELKNTLNENAPRQISSNENKVILYSDEALEYLDTAENNARNNGRHWADEADLFYAFFLTHPNPLYKFLNDNNIYYVEIFKKQK